MGDTKKKRVLKEQRTYEVSNIIDGMIEEFTRKILTLKMSKSLKNNWNKELEKLFTVVGCKTIKGENSNYVEINPELFVNVETLSKTVTAYRTKIKELGTDKEKVGLLLEHGQKVGKYNRRGIINLPLEMTEKRDNTRKKSLKERVNNVANVNDLQHIYDICLSYLDSPIWYKQVVGLMFFTGRRLSEILKEGQLTRTKTEGVLNFRGQLKTKAVVGYTIPVLHTKKVLKCFKNFRESARGKEFEGMHIDRASRNGKTSVNKEIRKEIGNMTSHKLRTLYAMYMEHYRGSRKKQTMKYMGDILGHTASNLNDDSTALTTEKYTIADINFNLNPEIAQQLQAIDYVYREV